MHDASPSRPRLVAFVAAFLAASAFAEQAASAADEEPAYFSERFGGHIERVVAGPDGTIYVAGYTWAADLPASTSSPDPGVDPYYPNNPVRLFFAAALERDGRPRWTSYAVGRPFTWTKTVRGLALAPDGSLWLAAVGAVDPVPETQPGFHEPGYYADVVVAKFSADGTLLFAGNLGGSGDDTVSDLAVAADGDAIVVGTTTANDFEGVPRPVTLQYSVPDAFVARLESDGSGPAWVRRFGGDVDGQHFHGCSVALDPSDGTILAGIVGSTSGARAPFASDAFPPRGVRTPRFRPWDVACEVIRLDGAGEQVQGARLPFLGSQAPVYRFDAPLAVAPDGTVVVGGALGVARMSRQIFLGAEGAWVHRWRYGVAARVCIDPAGRVVVAERENGYEEGLRITVRDPDFADGETSVDRATELGLQPTDIAVTADGALLVTGTGPGASFDAAYETADAPSGCIACVPLDGVRAPTRVRARGAGTREADLAWSRDGDAASGFDIERVPSNAAPLVLAHVAGDVFRHRLTGLTPGARHDLRVVAVFASGVRSASPVRSVMLSPEAPAAVFAEDGPGQKIDVRMDDPNGASTSWRIQRRFGDGAWMETGLYGVYPAPSRNVGGWLDAPAALDVVPDVAVPVTYRVQALVGRHRSAWTVSAPLVPQSTMRVTQTNGHFNVRTVKGVELLVAGTLAPSGAGPLTFDPLTDDFRLLYGPAAAPAEFVLPHGYPGWTSSDGRYLWRSSQSLTMWEDDSEILLDLGRGEFRVLLVGGYGSEVPIAQVAVNLAFGAFSGGDVRQWRGRTGFGEILRFGDEPEPAARARAR